MVRRAAAALRQRTLLAADILARFDELVDLVRTARMI